MLRRHFLNFRLTMVVAVAENDADRAPAHRRELQAVGIEGIYRTCALMDYRAIKDLELLARYCRSWHHFLPLHAVSAAILRMTSL